MQTSRTLLPVVVLVALAVGYLAGMVRQSSQPGTAAAGVTQLLDSSATHLTGDGTSLVVWRFKDGAPVSATLYARTSGGPEGDYLNVQPLAVRTAAKPK